MEKKLIEAAMKGDKSTIDELLQEDPLILHRISSLTNETPLHIAVTCGNLDFVAAILNYSNINHNNFLTKSDSSGRYPLHLACAGGHVEIAKELYRTCPEVSKFRDQDGRTPLELAAVNEHVEILSFLLFQQATDIEEIENGKQNVLHLCVRYNAMKALKLVVEDCLKRSNNAVNGGDECGNTILHLAVIHQRVEVLLYIHQIFLIIYFSFIVIFFVCFK